MRLPLSSIQQPKVGTCPHGLPQGACPICSGMGGGGGSAKKADKSTGEMSYDECYAVWQQMIKAKELAQHKKDLAMQAQMHTPVKLTQRLENAAQSIANLVEKLSKVNQKAQQNPTLLLKTLALGAKIAIPVLNVLKNIPVMVKKAINFVQEKFANISDKLSAIFGELKNATEKKISDRQKDFRKKFKTLFGIEDAQDTDKIDDEEKRIEESKRMYELKTVLQTIKEKFSKKEKENN